MLGIGDLKNSIQIGDSTVECPVRGCAQSVARQRVAFKKEPHFRCSNHGIYISPSTFEYETEADNLLWTTADDLALLSDVQNVKRESRMARDNSEDAVTWNVFRFLENNKLTNRIMGNLLDIELDNPRLVYWSYDQGEASAWSPLNAARLEFGEEIRRSSEPDIIIDSERTLLFVECKLTATNDTVPSNRDARKEYETGGERWFAKVFKSDYETVAIASQKYELMRFWLLGTWMARQLNKVFVLVNLVPESKELEIEASFGQHILQSERTRFARLTWESVYREVLNMEATVPDRDTMISYFQNKSAGYDGKGLLKKAFATEVKPK